MKLKLYIVTYNNNQLLNDWCLKTLTESTYPRDSVQVFVINNHTNIEINEAYKSVVTVIDNQARPDFSTGHLARNWNQGIINGFINLQSPDCDAVILCQNDIKFKSNWYELTTELLKQYEYVQFGHGDAFQAITPDCIKQVGIFDERFCSIGHQEIDYFIRLRNMIPAKVSINNLDEFKVNPVNYSVLEDAPPGAARGDINHNRSHHLYTAALCNYKQSVDSKVFYTYPYFEKDINSTLYQIPYNN